MPDLLVGGSTPLVPGSDKLACSRCGTEVYCGPTTRPIRQAGARVICRACFVDTYTEGELIVSPEVQAEVSRFLGRPVTQDELLDFILDMKRQAMEGGQNGIWDSS
mgnify:FL=1